MRKIPVSAWFQAKGRDVTKLSERSKMRTRTTARARVRSKVCLDALSSHYRFWTPYRMVFFFFPSPCLKETILMNILWENPKIWRLGSFPSYSILRHICLFVLLLRGIWFGSPLLMKGCKALGNTETDFPDKNEFYVSFFLPVPIKHK